MTIPMRDAGRPHDGIGLGYSMLDQGLRGVYTALEEGLYGRRSTIGVPRCTEKGLHAAFNAVLYDNPLLFDVGSDFRYTPLIGSITFRPTYVIGPEGTDRMRDEAMNILDRVRGELNGKSSYEKELRIHDMLAGSVEYDRSTVFRGTMVGPLLRGRGVCGGISLAASFLLNGVGVDTGVIIGKTHEGEGHAWNMTRIDGEWYHLDVTWDLSAYGGHMKHDYLNVDDRFMSRSRTWETAPAASSMMRNYHSMDGVVVYRLEDIPRIMQRLTAERRRKIEFRISEPLIPHYHKSAGTSALADALRGTGGIYSEYYNPITGCHVFDITYRRMRCEWHARNMRAQYRPFSPRMDPGDSSYHPR